jgi:hypothetical protein
MSKPSATAHRAAWWTVAILLLVPVYFLSVPPVFWWWALFQGSTDTEPAWLVSFVKPYQETCDRLADVPQAYPVSMALYRYEGWCYRVIAYPVVDPQVIIGRPALPPPLARPPP